MSQKLSLGVNHKLIGGIEQVCWVHQSCSILV